MHGTIISAPEVTNISRHSFWLLLGDQELLLPFEQFPWFRSATVEHIPLMLSAHPRIICTGPVWTWTWRWSRSGILRAFRWFRGVEHRATSMRTSPFSSATCTFKAPETGVRPLFPLIPRPHSYFRSEA